jgi:hypothetical protein
MRGICPSLTTQTVLTIITYLNMFTKDCLPLIDLATKQSASTISSTQKALHQFGAFRLVAPNLTQHLLHGVFQDARAFLSI